MVAKKAAIKDPDVLELAMSHRDVPKITLTAEFHDRPLDQQVKYLHALASTMNEAARISQKERDAAYDAAHRMEAQVKAMAKQLDLQTRLLQEQLQEANARCHEMGRRTQELKAQLSETARKLAENDAG